MDKGARGVSEGLETTFRLLGETENEAAANVLIAGLDSPHAAIREGALKAILSRRSPAGHWELVCRLHTLDEGSMDVIAARCDRISQALRNAILGSNPQVCANGCNAAVRFREYELMPTLISALEDHANANADVAGKALVELGNLLCGELAGSGRSGGNRDPRTMRQYAVGALEQSVERFGKHKRREVIETFLQLAQRENAILKQILRNPHHPGFLVIVDVLSNSSHEGVIRLLLSFLDDRHAPSGATSVIAKRADVKFLHYLLRKIGHGPSAVAAGNLKHVKSVGWLPGSEDLWEQLDDVAQHAVVQLIMASGIPRLEAFGTIEHLVLHGKPRGRRAASEVLAEFKGADANALAVKALEDKDPQVQANVLPQLRQRGIPGVLPRLVEMVDSPHAVVRQAARQSLTEFNFGRFVAAFDMLDEKVRHSTGKLVKKIDPQSIPSLQAEMESKVRTRRSRALAIATAMDVVDQLEFSIAAMLDDEDHLVRAEAAATLARCNSRSSRRALQRALQDSSHTVREAAENSLRERALVEEGIRG